MEISFEKFDELRNDIINEGKLSEEEIQNLDFCISGMKPYMEIQEENRKKYVESIEAEYNNIKNNYLTMFKSVDSSTTNCQEKINEATEEFINVLNEIDADTKTNIDALNKIDFLPYFKKFEGQDVTKLIEAVDNDYYNTEISNVEGLNGHIFNVMTFDMIVEYLKDRYYNSGYTLWKRDVVLIWTTVRKDLDEGTDKYLKSSAHNMAVKSVLDTIDLTKYLNGHDGESIRDIMNTINNEYKNNSDVMDFLDGKFLEQESFSTVDFSSYIRNRYNNDYYGIRYNYEENPMYLVSRN